MLPTKMNHQGRPAGRLGALSVAGVLALLSVAGCGSATASSSNASTLISAAAVVRTADPSVSGSLVPGVGSTSGPVAASVQPDGSIRLAGSGGDGVKTKSYGTTFVGDNIYNTTGAGQTDIKESYGELDGDYFVFEISIQNDGAQADKFTVKATGTGTGWTVEYLDGTADVSSLVLAGTYQTASLAPGLTYVVTAKVTFVTTLDVTQLVTITSVANSTKQDAVEFGIKEVPCGC